MVSDMLLVLVQPFPSLQHPFGLVGPVNLCYCKAEVFPHALEPSPPRVPPLSLGTPQLRDRAGGEDGDEDSPGIACGVAPCPHLITAPCDQRYHPSLNKKT